MVVKKKEDGRELSNVLSTYGVGYRGELTYDVYCGLVLNLDRVRLLDAVSVARGTAIAGSAEDLDRAWADALAVDPSEVDEILWQANKARMEARRQARVASQPISAQMGMG